MSDAPTRDQHNEYHRSHPFTLPTVGSVIVSPMTGTAYEIGEPLNDGAFGFVFECTDEWQQPLVAKILKPVGPWQDVEQRALNEGLAMAIARSPFIVHVHDMFVYKGAFIIVSERCDISLREMVRTPNMNAYLWFPAVARSVLNALHWMHVNDIGHCDVHLGNAFLQFKPDALTPSDRTRTVSAFKLGDLGLARALDQMKPEGTFLETWRPPEALDPAFGPVDHRSDLYQAGLLFLSFIKRVELQFSRQDILDGRPREVAEELSSPLGDAIAEMLRRRVDARPRTALDAWRRLKPCVQVQ